MSKSKIPTMALEPSLWGTLPKDLLHLVFAHLPIFGIGQLRVLSKEWKRNVDCKDSEFNQVFYAIAHLDMFALLSQKQGLFVSNIYDSQANKWHVLETNRVHEKTAAFNGANGGLVCYISHLTWHKNNPANFIVMNPLMNQQTQLPPLLSMGDEKTNNLQLITLKMVKLTIDRKSKYKVFVVSSIYSMILGPRPLFAQVYDSNIKEWTIVEATQGRIIGLNFFFMDLGVYNYANGTLQIFNETNIVPGLEVERGCYGLIEDHLFVLYKEVSSVSANLLDNGASMLQKYCISEYHLPEKSTTWVKLGVHSYVPCKCFRDIPYNIHNLRLLSCNGFLLVLGVCSQCTWLYNLSSCEWRSLLVCVKPLDINMMCEISWSAIA